MWTREMRPVIASTSRVEIAFPAKPMDPMPLGNSKNFVGSVGPRAQSSKFIHRKFPIPLKNSTGIFVIGFAPAKGQMNPV